MTIRTDARKYYPGMALQAEVHWLDNEDLEFGDAADVTMAWDGTNLNILPATDDTGQIRIGNGTLDMDFRVTLGTAAAYVQFDVGNVRVDYEGVDLRINDNDILQFGDDADVSMTWDGGSLNILPLTDNVGVIEIGNGTLDIDVQIFMNTAAQSVLFDVDASMVIFEGTDLRLNDTDFLQFGDDADVGISWDGDSLNILPLGNDVGRIEFGDGTTDMDVIFFVGDANNYLLHDVGLQKVYVLRTLAGGGDSYGVHVDTDVLAGTDGFRQGAIGIAMDRAVGQDFAGGWDGNPDTGLRIRQANRAANAVSRGGAQGFDVEGRNRAAGVLASARGGYVAGRNDATGEVDFLWGLFVRCENNGQINTEAVGLDVDMSIDDDTGNPTTTAIRIRSNGIVAPAVLDQVFLISHAQANGWDNLFYFNAVTGDTVSAGDLVPAHDPDVNSIGADFRIKCSVNGTDYWIPLYNGVV